MPRSGCCATSIPAPPETSFTLRRSAVTIALGDTWAFTNTRDQHASPIRVTNTRYQYTGELIDAGCVMRWLIVTLTAVSLGLTSGCEGQAQETWGYLEIIYSWSEINKAKQLAQEQAGQPLSARALRNLDTISLAAIPANMQLNKAAARLAQIANDKNHTPEVRARAFGVLHLIEPKAAEVLLVKILKGSTRKPLLQEVLKNHTPGMRFETPKLAEYLKSEIGTKGISVEVATICGIYEVPNSVKILGGAFKDADDPTKVAILQQLAEKRPSPKVVEVTLNTLEDIPDDLRQDCLAVLAALVQSNHKKAKLAASDALAEELSQLVSLGKTDYDEFPYDQCVALLHYGVGAKTREFCKLASRHFKYGILFEAIYTFECRDKGDAGWKRIEGDLRNPATFVQAFDAARIIYGDRKDAALASALRPMVQESWPPYAHVELGLTLLELDGVHSVDDVNLILAKLPTDYREELSYELNAYQPERVAEQLREVGLLDFGSAKDFVAGIIANRRGEKAKEDPRRVPLEELFEAAGLMITIETEHLKVPVRHDLLLYELGKGSSGEFDPQYCLEKMTSLQQDNLNSPYKAQFVHHDVLYRFKLRNYGGDYDMQRIIAVCNQAMRDDGSDHQFQQAAGYGYSVFCVTPKESEVLKEEFRISWIHELKAKWEAEKSPEQKTFDYFNRNR